MLLGRTKKSHPYGTVDPKQRSPPKREWKSFRWFDIHHRVKPRVETMNYTVKGLR